MRKAISQEILLRSSVKNTNFLKTQNYIILWWNRSAALEEIGVKIQNEVIVWTE